MSLRTQEHLWVYNDRAKFQNFMEIVWTVFEKFEIFIERSGEKNATIALVENFPTPKNEDLGN